MLHRNTSNFRAGLHPQFWAPGVEFFLCKVCSKACGRPNLSHFGLAGMQRMGHRTYSSIISGQFLRESPVQIIFGRAWQDHCLQTSGKFAYCRSWASFQVDGMMLCGLNLIPKSSLPIQSFHAHLSRRSTIISNVTSLWHAVADSNAWDVSTKQQDATGSKLYRLYIQ